MFDEENRSSPSMDDYGVLEGAATCLITNDHDVFDDGSVTIIQAPGHTPGHVVLLVRLAEPGPSRSWCQRLGHGSSSSMSSRTTTGYRSCPRAFDSAFTRLSRCR